MMRILTVHYFRKLSDEGLNSEMIQTLTHSPGAGTTCMFNDPGESHRWSCTSEMDDHFAYPANDIEADKMSLYTNPADCTCEKNGDQICPEGAGGMPQPYMKLGTGDYLYNITGSQFSTDEYLLRTHNEFIKEG